MKITADRKNLMMARLEFYMSQSREYFRIGDFVESEKFLAMFRGAVHMLGELAVISRRYELLICAQPVNEKPLNHSLFILHEYLRLGCEAILTPKESYLEGLYRSILDGVKEN